jgi:diguanylate cyclase (GGDEF)-like protein
MGRSPERWRARPPVRPWGITRWEVWQLRGRVITAVLLVDGLALLLVGVQAATPSVEGRDIRFAGVLALLGIVHTEVASSVERLRRRLSDTSYYDLSSVWTFAAALLLPPLLAAAVVVAVYLHLWIRVWRPAKKLLYRNVYTVAAVVLAAQAAHAVVAGRGGLPTWTDGAAGLGLLALAVLAYAVVNNALIIGAIALGSDALPGGRRVRCRDLLGQLDDVVLELATLSLGALTAVALALDPWLVVFVLVPLLVLHRADVARQLEQRADTDGKTGLLNAAAWHEKAERALRRAQRQGSAAGVLILDLDHFKEVNDSYGHLAGDEVLLAVAAALSTEVREGDVVGRFGGEEFVVLLRDLELTSAGRRQMERVAERIRERIEELAVVVRTPDGPLTITGLSTSVGGVFHLGRTSSLQQVLSAADAALYTAKREGRNLVRFGPSGVVPVVPPPAPPRPPELRSGSADPVAPVSRRPGASPVRP